MDRDVDTLRHSSGSRLSLGHRPDGRCPHCWMGMVRRPFRAPRSRANDVTQLPERPGGTSDQGPHSDPPSETVTAPVSTVTLDREARFGDIRYPIYVRSGPAAWPELARLLTGLHADRFLLVTDGGVPEAAVQTIARELDAVAPVTLLQVPAREHAKNLSTIDELAKAAFASGATRMSVFVALGGGLAGNVAGLLAHLFLRGARLVHIPTTLL